MEVEKKMMCRCEIEQHCTPGLVFWSSGGYICPNHREHYIAGRVITRIDEQEDEETHGRIWRFRRNYPDQTILTVPEYPPFVSPPTHQGQGEEAALGFQLYPVGETNYFELQLYPVLLFEKELDCCDVALCPNRLLITKSCGRNALLMALTEHERRQVMDGGDSLRVVTTDTNSEGLAYHMRLKKEEADGGAVVLARDWSMLIHINRLKRGDTVQGWGYRLGRAPAEFRLEIVPIKKT